MQADELENRLALLGVEVQPGQECVGQLHALPGMFAGAAGLAGVVQQQRQQEEIEAVDLRQQLRQPLLVVVGGLAQAVDVVDGQEGVLVDGIAVIAVANHQGVDAVELGNQHLQHAQRMHGAQRVGGVGPEQNLAQRVPQIGPLGDVDGQNRQRVGDAVFGGLRERVAVRGHQREDAQDGAGVVELRAGQNVDAALVEQEVGSGDGRAAAAELAIEADRSGQVLHQQRGAAIDDAGVAVIGPHPVGGIGGAAGFKADGVRGGLVLRLPVERVVVAAVAEVEKTSRGGEKVEGRLGVAAGALEDAAALAGPLLGLLQVEEQREPDGQVIVAQPAGTILEVGFEMKDGVAELGVAGAGDLAQLLRDGVPLAQHQAGKDDLVQLLVERETGRPGSGGRGWPA